MPDDNDTDTGWVPTKSEMKDGRKYASDWLKGLSDPARRTLSAHDAGALKLKFAQALHDQALGLNANKTDKGGV